MATEDIILSRIGQSQKDKYCKIPLYEVFKIVKFIESNSGMVVARVWGEEEMGVTNQ